MSCMAGQTGEEEKAARFIMASSSNGLVGYNNNCYNNTTTDHASSSNGNQNTSHLMMNQFHNFHESNQEIYNFSSSMDHLIGFPPAWNNNTQQQQQQQHQSVTFPSHDVNVNEIRPIQKGLSLSLSTTSNPPTIGVNSFQLTQNDDLRFGTSSSRDETNRVSRYLGPAQELLNEFCNLGVDENGINPKLKAKMKNSEWQDGNTDQVNKNQSLYSLDLVELHKRKTKLLILLEEVDKRYKHYCNQMKSVVQSFEAVAGNGAAKVYSALASRAMSRHFRCLKDGIVNQIKSTKKAMEEKDTNTPPGSTKGETPRLRLLDQTLRQQRAFQQMGMIESHPWRPQRGLPERSVSVLRAWLFEHFLHPYPSDVDKHILSRQTGLSRSQVSNWFINARVRLWKPMVEEMYVEEFKEEGNLVPDDLVENTDMQNQNLLGNEDQKPSQHQLTRIDSECLSSIINNSDKHDGGKNGKALVGEQSYGAMELDFSSYGHQTRDRNVSLTLGLQQHGEGGVNLGLFPTTSSQNALFYPRDEPNNMEDWQTVQYSLLDDQSQAFRNFDGC